MDHDARSGAGSTAVEPCKQWRAELVGLLKGCFDVKEKERLLRGQRRRRTIGHDELRTKRWKE